MESTWVTMKLAFAFMPATLLGVIPVSVLLVGKGSMTVSQMALSVMLAMSMVISMAKIEIFSNGLRQMQYTVLEIQKLLNIKSLVVSDGEIIERGTHGELMGQNGTYAHMVSLQAS